MAASRTARRGGVCRCPRAARSKLEPFRTKGRRSGVCLFFFPGSRSDAAAGGVGIKPLSTGAAMSRHPPHAKHNVVDDPPRLGGNDIPRATAGTPEFSRFDFDVLADFQIGV